MKYLQRIFSLLLIGGMILGWTASGSSLARTSLPSTFSAEPGSKFEALVLDELNSGSADFFVTMTEQADLSHADQLRTKIEKGQYVFDSLVATADRTQADLKSFLDGQGVKYESFYIVNTILVKSGTLSLANAIAARSDVAQITANHPFQLEDPVRENHAKTTPDAIEPNLTFIKADQVWAMGFTGQGTVMAGNDTGLDETHPTVARHYRGCVNPPSCTTWDHNYNWWDATGTYPTNPYDGFGHGTHTTGTMVGDDGGANQIGVAPGAQTVHCKNMTDGGSGDDGTFLTCFEWDLAPWDLNHQNPLVSKAPDAINNSWGYWGGGNNVFRTAINNLQAAGVLVEVSAGNEGPSCSTLRSPGDYVEVLTTGSVDHVGQTFPGIITNASWSPSRGPSDLDPSPPNYFPDIMAPGHDIRSALPGNTYDYWSGTSMAGPHATALVGLMWSAAPALQGQVAQTLEIIRATAAPLTGQGGSNCGGNYTTGPNNDWGFGTINALAAVQAAVALGGSGQLDGTVTDASTSNPIQGVNIHAAHESGFAWDFVTDVNGYYTKTLAAGLYTLTASTYGYLTEVDTGVQVITDTLTTHNFALTPATEYTVSGYVTDLATGDPLAAQVQFLDAPVAPVNTDPSTGFYSLQVIEGTWTLQATAAQHASQTVTVEVTGDTQQDFALSPFCDLIADDVENGNVGWTIQSPWAITAESSHSPTHSWTDSPGGPYQNYVNTSLTSPVLDLSNFTDVKLNFWHTYATETGYDYANVEVSTNGGSTWTTVESYEGTSANWSEVELLLPQLDDQANVKIRFHFTSDVSITYDGWHLDDIALRGGGPGCVPDSPVEGLTATSTSPDALGTPTTLTAEVTGGTNVVYTWDFGDGTTGDGAVVDHTYTAVGVYEATVTASNSANTLTDTTTVVIEVPVAGLTATNDGPTSLGDPTTFTAAVTGGSNLVYTWDFGDGTTGTGQVATHVYATAGSFTATVTATNALGSAQAETIADVEVSTFTFFIPFVSKH